jgi:hypothetical protein
MPRTRESRYLSPQELAAELGIGRRQAYALAAELGAKIGARVVVSRRRLERWINRGGHRARPRGEAVAQ